MNVCGKCKQARKLHKFAPCLPEKGHDWSAAHHLVLQPIRNQKYNINIFPVTSPRKPCLCSRLCLRRKLALNSHMTMAFHLSVPFQKANQLGSQPPLPQSSRLPWIVWDWTGELLHGKMHWTSTRTVRPWLVGFFHILSNQQAPKTIRDQAASYITVHHDTCLEKKKEQKKSILTPIKI